jgi:D-arabinose 1-dehydrogenase-like Zn-dependent alcohol dehydrogenase
VIGISGSEIEGYLGRMGNRTPPLVMGHEFAGEIVAGAREWVGRRAAVNPLVGCGRCQLCRSIAAVNDGDLVTIDLDAGRLEVDLSEEELARRLASLTSPEPRFTRGVYARYTAQVASASEGAVLLAPTAQAMPVDA